MKKNRPTKTTRAALFTGAAALMALTPSIRGQSSSDALINKLEQKGILSAAEAKELRAESRQDFNSSFTNSFDKAFGKITGMPDWVTGYKLSGDFRGRFEDFTGDNPDFPDRIRLRYRLRVGLTVNMKDDLQAGFRLASGDSAGGSFGGNPLSNNSTFQDDFTKKFLYIDAAYGKWTAINDGTWLVATTIGKMDNPFPLTAMVFDPDLTPEGAVIQAGYKINDVHSLALIGAAFVLDEQKLSSQDPFMYGAQLQWNAKWTPRLESSLGVAVFDIVNRDLLTVGSSGKAVDSVPTVNLGNTRAPTTPLSGSPGDITYGLRYNYNPIIADASVTYTLDTFPLYRGKFPIKLTGEFMDNPGAADKNHGYWGGVTFGKSGKKGTWDVSYRYEYLEADAWYDQLVDDDMAAFYSNPVNGGPTPSSTVTSAPSPIGVFGGTNLKGHLVRFNYSITDALTFSAICYVSDLINPELNVQSTLLGPAQPQNNVIHLMADLMWKF